jgi:hypothetical protein
LQITVLRALSVKLGGGVAVAHVPSWKWCAALPAFAIG